MANRAGNEQGCCACLHHQQFGDSEAYGVRLGECFVEFFEANCVKCLKAKKHMDDIPPEDEVLCLPSRLRN
jgi:hypothetical protein